MPPSPPAHRTERSPSSDFIRDVLESQRRLDRPIGSTRSETRDRDLSIVFGDWETPAIKEMVLATLPGSETDGGTTTQEREADEDVDGETIWAPSEKLKNKIECWLQDVDIPQKV